MKTVLIAPCGMNCNLCKAHLRSKNKCPGCNSSDTHFTRKCIIKYCNKRGRFCDCEDLPCQRLKNLDKRYRTKYNMSMLENLKFIKKHGVREFVKKEEKRWKCKKCGGVVSVHDGKCYSCEVE